MKWIWIPVIAMGVIFLSAIGAVVGMVVGMIAVPAMIVVWLNDGSILGNNNNTTNNNQDRI